MLILLGQVTDCSGGKKFWQAVRSSRLDLLCILIIILHTYCSTYLLFYVLFILYTYSLVYLIFYQARLTFQEKKTGRLCAVPRGSRQTPHSLRLIISLSTQWCLKTAKEKSGSWVKNKIVGHRQNKNKREKKVRCLDVQFFRSRESIYFN